MKRILSLALTFIFWSHLALSQNSYTFTPCGAVGSAGPSQTQINNTYSNTTLQGSVVASTGRQVFTLTTAGIYQIEAVGGKGGNAAYTYTGGAGARVIAQYTLPANTVFTILVGQSGANGTAFSAYATAGGGGGGSYVAMNGSIAVVAGGGGGAGIGELGANGFNGNGGSSTTSGTSANGTNNQSNGVAGSNGSGGTGGAYWGGGGGAGINSNGGNSASGTIGYGGVRFSTGGNGGNSGSYNSAVAGVGGFGGGGGSMFGGGGGGGYSGGAGGTHGANYNATGGGGGGSFASSSANTITAGFNAGTGYVIIRRMFGPTISVSSSITCNGASNGALTATVTGGTAPFSYTWLPAGGSGSVASNLAAGVYTLQVSDANSQLAETTFTLNQPAAVSASFNYTHATCFGYANGIANANVTGGTAPYSVTWTPSGINSNSISGLSAGTYTALILDANNCFGTSIATITQPASFAVTANATTPTLCTGGFVTLTGGGASSYAWSNSVVNGQAFSPTTTITYTVTGTLNSCTNIAMTTVSVFPRPTVTVASGSVCAGLSYVINPSGANSYTIQGGSFTVTPSSTTNYTLVGMNGFGCLSATINTVNVTVSPYPVVTISGTNTACSGNAIALTASGASTYTWINTSATGSVGLFSPTSLTNYTVAGTNNAGCTSNSSAFQVTVIPSPTLSVSGATSVCAGNALQLTAAGAVTYTWNNGNNNASLLAFPLNNTTYTVFGNSANGCLGSLTVPVTVNALPNLSISGNSVICQGGSSTFSASGASSYTWSTGSNASSVTVSPLITYTISVNGASSAGCVQTAAQVLTVNPLPALNIAGQTAICSGNSQTLTVTGANSYTWSQGSQNANIIVTPPIGSGVFTLFVSGTNNAGCVATSTVGVPVNPTPTVSINGNTMICAGGIATLSANGANSYVWSNNLTNASINVSPASNATYSVIGTTTAGCMGMANVSVMVFTNPTLSITGNNSVCAGNQANLSVTGASTYTWSNAVNNSSIIVTPTITSNYSVIGQTTAGCTGTANISVAVVALPTLSILGSTAVCEGKTSTLSVIGASSYVWNTGSTVNVISITPTASTVYSVTGTSSLGCNGIKQVSVDLLASPQVSITVVSNTVCLGEVINLQATGAATYSWINGPTAASIAVTPTTTSNYSVVGTATNGCSRQANLTLNVTDCTNLSNNDLKFIKVYPNPSSGVIHVTGNFQSEGTVRVINAAGQLIIESKLTQDNEIDLSAFANGLYHVLIMDGQSVHQSTIIKQ